MKFVVLFLFPVLAWASPVYDAHVVRVIDGDTVAMDVAIWPGLTQRVNVRLEAVNAPELRSHRECERGTARQAKAFVQAFLRPGRAQITDVRRGKYAGRVLGRISVNGQDLGGALLARGLARPYHGGKREQWCE